MARINNPKIVTRDQYLTVLAAKYVREYDGAATSFHAHIADKVSGLEYDEAAHLTYLCMVKQIRKMQAEIYGG